MSDEQRQAMMKMLNLIMALSVHCEFGAQAHRDIWDAAEAFGISKLDLLKATREETPGLVQMGCGPICKDGG